MKWHIKRDGHFVAGNFDKLVNAKQAARRLVNPGQPEQFTVVNDDDTELWSGWYNGKKMKWEKYGKYGG